MSTNSPQSLRALIEEATHKKRAQLDSQYYKVLKQHLRNSEDAVAQAFEVLHDRLQASHAQNLGSFLELTIGHNTNKLLPGPPDVARTLRQKSLSYLQSWKESAGDAYPQLTVAVKYLKDVLKLQFPEIVTPSSRREAEQAEQQRRLQQHLRTRYGQLELEMADQLAAAKSLLLQMDECFRLLDSESQPAEDGPGVEPASGSAPDDAMEWEDAAPDGAHSLSQGQLDDLFEEEEGLSSYAPTAAEELAAQTTSAISQQDAEQDMEERAAKDDSVLGMLRDLLKQANAGVGPWLASTMQVLVQLNLPPDDPLAAARQQHLREVVALNTRLKAGRDRARKHGVVVHTRPRATAAVGQATSSRRPGNNAAAGISDSTPAALGQPTQGSSGPEPVSESLEAVKLPAEVRERLLKAAPTLPTGSHKVQLPPSWALANPSGLEVYNHWGPVDNTAERPSEQLQLLMGYSAAYYEPSSSSQPAKTQATGRRGATLPAGGEQQEVAPRLTLEEHISMLTAQQGRSGDGGGDTVPTDGAGEGRGVGGGAAAADSLPGHGAQGPSTSAHRAASAPSPAASTSTAVRVGPRVPSPPTSAGMRVGPGIPGPLLGGEQGTGPLGPGAALRDRRQRRKEEREYNMRVIAEAGDEEVARQLQLEDDRQQAAGGAARKKSKKMTAGQKLLKKLARP